MAIIRDNRGALLASNLSKYLAGAANTAGTPIDTNEMVKIVNQFLGQNEQISSDMNTISNGIYKRFLTNDKITNKTEVVTTGIWSGDTGSLGILYTSTNQINSNSGKYYIDVYNKATSSSDAEVQFSVAFGDVRGYGSPSIADDENSVVASKAVYNQFRNVLLGSTDPYFTVYSGSTPNAYDVQQIYAINVNRARYRERLDPGNISIDMGTYNLIDDSGGTDESVTTAGRIYNIVEGDLNIGTAGGATITSYTSSNGQGYGLFYPDFGVIILNAEAISSKSSLANLVSANTSSAGVYFNNTAGSGSRLLISTISTGADFQARRTENVSTSHYFIRANNREFNFSNNPTFVTGSTGQFVQGAFERDPHVYITTVGLYDDANELLAVAKTSRPIEKTFDKEVAIKVKLDF
jgi:hypothetical protein